MGFVDIAGVDDVGRGCLAGPVTAAVVVLPHQIRIPGIKDSKVLTAEEREALFGEITHFALRWHVASVDPTEIDRINIHQASLLAMRRAIEALIPLPGFVLVDGPTERVLGEGAAATWEQVRNLLNQALDDLAAVETAPWQRGRRAAAVRLDEIAEAELRRAGITPGHPSLHGDDEGPG